jgi:hypothetical protein
MTHDDRSAAKPADTELDRELHSALELDEEDDSALTPEQMLKLVDDQQSDVVRKQLAPIPWMLGVWGVAWLVGFLLLWSAAPQSNSLVTVSGPVAGIGFGVLIGAAIAASTVLGIRIGRGVQGNSSFAGAVYGISWALCGTAFGMVGVALRNNGMSYELATLYFPSAFALMAGTLYLAGAALWHQKSQLVLGIILLVTGSVSPFFGAPTNNLVMALLGGGTMLFMAVLAAVRLRRTV